MNTLINPEILKVEGFKAVYKGVPPFMKYEKGHGFYGVLLEEESTGKLQCHICGEVALNLSKHLYHKHKEIKSTQYKVLTGLSLGTPLMSESTRKKIKNNFLNLTEEKKDEVVARLRNLNKRLHSGYKEQRKNKASIQVNNRYGTCPEQVKSQFWEKYQALGRLPNLQELSGRLRYIIETRFGSYEEAVVVWGIPRAEFKEHLEICKERAKDVRKANDYYPKYSKEEVIEIYSNFFKVNRRFPTWGEVALNGMPGRIPFKRAFGSNKSEIKKQFNLTN